MESWPPFRVSGRRSARYRLTRSPCAVSTACGVSLRPRLRSVAPFRKLLSWAWAPPSGLRLEPRRRPARRRSLAQRASCTGPAALMRFLPLQRLRSRESGSRGGCHAPATFRPQGFAPSRRLPPPETFRACSIPERSWGSRLQGLDPSRRAAPLSGPHPLLPLTAHRREATRSSAPEVSSLPKAAPRPSEPLGPDDATVALLAFLPSRALRPSAMEPVSRSLLSCALRGPASRTARACASESRSAEGPASPPRGGAGPSGVCHLVTEAAEL